MFHILRQRDEKQYNMGTLTNQGQNANAQRKIVGQYTVTARWTLKIC